eukprot:11230694-Karenia_brevis.AAC.1
MSGAFRKLSSVELQRAIETSRIERREAQRKGRTHVLAAKRAKRPVGTIGAFDCSSLRPLKRLRTKTAPADVTFIFCGPPAAPKNVGR